MMSYTNEQSTTQNRCVYLIQAGDMRMTKIGLAINPGARLKELQTGNPHILKLCYVLTVEQAAYLEAKLHRYFKDHRLRGEWFELFADDIIDEIKSWDEIQQVVPGVFWSIQKYFQPKKRHTALVVRSVGSWDGTFLPDYSDSECQLLSQMGVSYRRHKSETRRFGLYVRGALCGLALAILGTLQLFVDIGINHDETFIYRATALVAIMWVCDLIVWALLIYPHFNPYWYQQIEAYHRHWRQMRESL
jgi:hypothetical protein